MLSRLLVFLGLRPKTARPSGRTAPAAPPRPRALAEVEPKAEPEPEPESAFPAARGWHPDIVSTQTLTPSERELFERLKERIATGVLDLPRLPSSVQKLSTLVATPGVEFDEIVATLSTDPALSSETFKQANSVLMGAMVDCGSLNDAVSRLGMRRLRGIVLGMSMRSEVLRGPILVEHAEEIWRQALTIAHIASHVARAAKLSPDAAYLMGLTHDIGKVALLSMLSKEKPGKGTISGAFLGTMFVGYHEKVGVRMATEWELPEEVVAIAGHHHDPASNPTHPREAALISLSHRMDLLISQGAEVDYRALARCAEMDMLGIEPDKRHDLLSQVLEVVAASQAVAQAA